MDQMRRYDCNYISPKDHQVYCERPENVIDSLISIWMNWMVEQEKSMDKNLPISERVMSVRKCEDYMRFKHIQMQYCDEYFKCLEKKN